MNKNVLIVLAGGFVVAILVAVLVQASLGGKKTDDTGPKTQVLVAAKNLTLGKDLAEGDLKWQTWPGSAFEGAIVRKGEQKPEEVLKGRMIQRVSAGQPVLGSYIFKEGKGNVVAATLEPGQRGMAIPVKAFKMAGGFITPGDHVDVILTYKVSVERRERTFEINSFLRTHASETVLKNIRVLAVDQAASRDEDEDGEGKIGKTVTLAVDAKQAEKLALASEMGDLTLALRGIGDDKDTNPEAITTDIEVSRAMQNIVHIKEKELTARPVRIYSGATMTETTPRSNLPALPAAVANEEGAGMMEDAEEDYDETDFLSDSDMSTIEAIGVVTEAIGDAQGETQ